MGASKFGCYDLWLRNCTIYLDFHKWVLQILDVMSASLGCLLAGRNGNVELKKKKKLYKDSLELFRNIYTINTFILLFCSYFCMYVYIYVYIFMFNCTCPPFKNF